MLSIPFTRRVCVCVCTLYVQCIPLYFLNKTLVHTIFFSEFILYTVDINITFCLRNTIFSILNDLAISTRLTYNVYATILSYVFKHSIDLLSSLSTAKKHRRHFVKMFSFFSIRRNSIIKIAYTQSQSHGNANIDMNRLGNPTFALNLFYTFS